MKFAVLLTLALASTSTFAASFAQRVNLIKSMITGNKPA